jgi:hypothetical protein
MPNATNSTGDLLNIDDCYVNVPGYGQIKMHSLPDISDSKSAIYHDEVVMGRALPLKTYSHSDNRNISLQLHFFVRKQSDILTNLGALQALESAVYPREGQANAPYVPPPICKIKCGSLLAKNELCVVLKNYSVRFPTDVAWDLNTLIPYKFDVDTNWEVVYVTSDLPGQSRILQTGR